MVRHRLPDGRATDVIGRLVHLDAASVSVRPAGGADVRVLADDVVASRVVGEPRVRRQDRDRDRDHGRRRPEHHGRDSPESSGSPDSPGSRGALSTPVGLAAARTGLGWSGRRVEPLGGWLLRSGPARMMRGRSALAAGDPGVPLQGAVDAVVDHYRGLGLTPAVQVSSAFPGPGADGPSRPTADDGSTALEELLAASGWVPQPWTVLALRPAARTGPSGAAVPAPVPATIRVAPSPDATWFAASDHHGAPLSPGDLPPERDGVALAYATARAPRDVAEVPDHAVGVARGALAEGWLGITCVSVDPAHRRRGVAGALVAALDAELGASTLYVQVVETNDGARGLWRALGFTDHSRYRFWTLPDAG